MLVGAVVAVTLALVFYSWGVWAERFRGTLLGRHVVAFAIGLACDAFGTMMMSRLAAANTSGVAPRDGFTMIMMWTGGVAIALMTFHLGWAIVVLIRNRPSERARFHVLSLIVWSFWLVPYLTGAIGSSVGP